MSEILRLSGKLTMDSVAARMAEIESSLQQCSGKADAALSLNLGDVVDVDSSAVAVMLHWLRQARQAQVTLYFQDLPASLAGLLAVYHLQDFFVPRAPT